MSGSSTLVIFTAAFLLIASAIVGCGKDDSTGPGGNGTSIDTIPPAPITDLNIRAVGTDYVSLIWTAPGDDGRSGIASAYDLRHHSSVINESNWEQATRVIGLPVPKESGRIENFAVNQLACSTEYHFAMKALDEVPNVSGLSDCPAAVTRQERVPPMPVGDLSAAAISDTSFLLKWTAPGDDGLAGTAFQYDIRCSRFPISTSNWASVIRVDCDSSPKAGGEPDSFVVSGLDPGVNYYFAMKASDEVPNWSGMSNCCSAMAFSEVLLVAPNSFTIGTVDDVTVTFRAQAGVRVKIEIWGHEPSYRRNLFYELVNALFTEGIHTVHWDLYSDIFEMYVDEDRYEFELYYDGVLQDVKDLRVFNP